MLMSVKPKILVFSKFWIIHLNMEVLFSENISYSDQHKNNDILKDYILLNKLIQKNLEVEWFRKPNYHSRQKKQESIIKKNKKNFQTDQNNLKTTIKRYRYSFFFS